MSLTKSDAQAIAKKLGAEIRKGRRGRKGGRSHVQACIFVHGKLVAHFGIRHGSRDDQGHDHIPRDILETPYNTRLLSECPRSREDWLRSMDEKGKLPKRAKSKRR